MRRTVLCAFMGFLISSSASAARLNINGVPNATVVPDLQGQITAVFTLDNPDGFALAGFSLVVVNVEPDEVDLIDFHNDNPIFPPSWQPCMIEPWLCPNPLGPLEEKIDLGGTGDFDTQFDDRNPIPLRTIRLQLKPGVVVTDESPLIITFRFHGYDLELNEATSDASLTVIPEPVCLALFSVGAALFARRAKRDR